MIFFHLFHKHTTCQKSTCEEAAVCPCGNGSQVCGRAFHVLWGAPTRRVFLCCNGTLFSSWIIYFSKECEGEFAGNL